MRQIILAALLCAASVFADDATLLGQKIVTEAPIGWGSSTSRTLKITSNAYLRDSASTFVAIDTSVASVGGAGACSNSIVIRSGSALTPQLRCELSYQVRATDVSEDGFDIYLASRYRTPAGTDSGWVLPGKNYYLDSLLVNQTHTNPGASTSYTTRLVNFYVSGQETRVCVNRASTGGPGVGDTIFFSNNWIRCW